MLVFPTRAVPLKDDSAGTRSGWAAAKSPLPLKKTVQEHLKEVMEDD
jgi:hypothetical protein